MFIFVVALVTVLDWFKPDNLTFDKSANLTKLISRVEKQIQQNSKLSELLRLGMFMRMNKRYAEAVLAYEKAVLIDEESNEALIGLAVTKSYTNTSDYSEPLRLLDKVIQRSPHDGIALYNRACLRCLSGTAWSKKDWLSDLQEALRQLPAYCDYAKNDDDFKGFQDDAEFKRVVAEFAK